MATTDTPALPLLKGTLDFLILKALSFGPMHGYGIASWLEQQSRKEISVDDSALYQALQRMEGRGWVTAEWGLTENNRRARYYTISRPGRDHLRAETATWLRYTRSVTAILTLATRTA
ncbi:MAG: PadR family transcriptional regulator [Gemmatimonadales bacterium]